jgi:6-phosphofructokinase
MSILYGNAVVGQSGGPTAAINATLCGVIRGSLAASEKGIINTLYGMRNGIEGFLKESMVNLSEMFSDEGKLKALETTPAAALGSCRKKMKSPEDDPETYDRLIEIFKKYNIRYFFYIGGNDSMDTVSKLSLYAASKNYEMRVVGVPKTIDNDLMITDHTPGFGSAAKYVAVTMKEILRDVSVYTMKAVTIVEIMGRDAGWLTASAALAGISDGVGADLIYLPERAFDIDKFIESINKTFEDHPAVLVAVSEGIHNKRRTRVKRIRLERDTLFIRGFNVDNALAYGVEPVSALVICLLLSRPIEKLVQILEFPLYAFPAGDVKRWLSQEIPVFKLHDLRSVVHGNLVQDVLPHILRPAEDGLYASPIPVQKLFLEHICDVVHQSGVEFWNDVVGVDVIEGGVDVQTPEHIRPNNRFSCNSVCHQKTPQITKIGHGIIRDPYLRSLRGTYHSAAPLYFVFGGCSSFRLILTTAIPIRSFFTSAMSPSLRIALIAARTSRNLEISIIISPILCGLYHTSP